MTVDVIIPTYKPDKRIFELIDKLENQSIRPEHIILMNTEEKYLSSLFYGTDYKNRYKNIVIKNISRREFNHGKTRNEGAKRADSDIMIFMTQDAFPKDTQLIEKLLAPHTDPLVAVSYARQVANDNASPLEIFSRSFNYPNEDKVKSKADLELLGIKTYFCSNACAAYKRQVFNELGGFVNFTIFNEDMLFAAKAIEAGKKIAYASGAVVEHSHNYSGLQQLKRNFDLGVSQADHPEVFENLKSEGEGVKLVKDTARYLSKCGKIYLVPQLIYVSGCKLIGYKLGKNYKKLSKKRILRYTMSPAYWERYWDKHEIPENVYAGYGKNQEGL